MDAKSVAEVKQQYFSTYGHLGLCEYRIDHPAFAKWKAKRNYSHRLKTILSTFGNVKGKRILDIGCCEGAFCHQLAKKGAKMVGVDYNVARIDIAKTISKLYGLSPKNPIFQAITFEKLLKWKGVGRFDFILFLSLFHHFLRRGLKSTWQKINLVSQHTNILFLEADINPVHCHLLVKQLGYKQAQMRKIIPQLIVKHSRFKSFKELPTKRIKRPFFVFTK